MNSSIPAVGRECVNQGTIQETLNPLLGARLGAACLVSLHSQEIAVSCTANHDVWAVCPPLIPMDILPLGSINRSTGHHLSLLKWCFSYSVPSLLPKLQIRNCEGPELFLGLQPSKPVGQPDYKYKTPSQRQRLFVTAKAAAICTGFPCLYLHIQAPDVSFMQ